MNEINDRYIDALALQKTLGLSQSRISRLLTQGRFNGAFKFGGTWLVPKEAVASFEYKKRGPKVGIKKKPAKELELLSQLLQESKHARTLDS